ncbi:MAG: hypothetical protein HQM06_10595 [Magnetococcales bacterium]|nr:hypothetical protein [Magnetococcales bacterium]
MLNSIAVGAVYAIPHPLLNLWNQQRIGAQIQTNNNEQVSLRPVTRADAQAPQQAVVSRNESAEIAAIREALNHRPDRPLLETGTLAPVNPLQATTAFRRVNELLVNDALTRDPANRTKTINVYV